MNTLPTGTVTFLFTDMEGSTKLWEQHPDAMPRALARHDQLLQEAIEASGGHVFKTVGDAFCAAFANPHNALQAALAAQAALTGEAWSLPLVVRVRMGLHTGAADERGGDYFGPPLNRVARLMAAGHGGQILLSQASEALLGGALPPDVTMLDMGRHHLKDLGRAEQVFQVCHPALAADFPPLRTLDNPALPNNLPQQATSFVGRQQEAAQIKALLAQTRLLTLTGAGGSGKTRLSLQVAADLLSGDGDGVWLVELAPLSDPALVAQEAARALSIAEKPGQTMTQTLVQGLKDKRLLLVLDNCEHLVPACAALADALLKGCPDIHLLASSRERLGVSGEQTYPVPPLSVPSSAGAQTADVMVGHEAVRLFAERAQAAQPSWMLTDGNASAVAQVCRRLDGIPLALELAAARVRALPVEQINARLDNRFRLLTGGSRTALPRQQTLRALIDWSYDLLGESERALLRGLSVFAGGWTLDAAEAVCAGETLEEWEVLDVLTALVDKSLVVYDEQDDIARYRLLENIRQYGRERLAEHGEAEELARRHSTWCLALAQQAEPHMTGPEAALWLNRLEEEHDNLRAALRWYEGASDGAESGLRLCGMLWRFWSVHGHFTEGRQWLGRALERTQNLDAPGPRMAALLGAGSLANAQCDQDSARSSFNEMLDMARAAEDNKNVAEALNGLYGTAYDQSDYATARVLREQCLEVQRQIGDQNGITVSLGSLGNLAYQRGDHAAARAFIEEAIALMRQLGNPRALAGWVNNLGIITATQGDFDKARTLYLEALAIRRELGDLLGIARTLNSLGVLAADQEDWDTARPLYEESLVLCRQIGNTWSTATALGNLGLAAEEQGDLDKARALQEECLALSRQIGSVSGIAVALNPLGKLAARRGDTVEAVRCFREELELAHRMDSLYDISNALRGLAFLAVQQGRLERAVRMEGAAAAAQEQHGGAIPVSIRLDQEKVLADARASLGNSAFDAAWAAGRAMTWEDAAADGLSAQ